MNDEPTRIRAVAADGMTEVRLRMSHPMETGFREDGQGRTIPPHYITRVRIEHDGRVVLDVEVGPALAADPYLAFSFRGGQAGERITVSWWDTEGNEREDEAEIR